MGRNRYAIDKMKANLIDNHTSYIYEEISREKLSALAEDGKLTFSFNRIGAWWNKSSEIDIVAYDSFGEDICFGECKFKKDKVVIDVYNALIEKSKRVEWKAGERKEYFALFSIDGFTDELAVLAKNENNFFYFD